MGLAEMSMALPWLYLLFGVRAFLPLNTPPWTAFLSIVVLVGILGWARPSRLVRAVVLSAREREYVLAARSFGASNFHLVRRHILPQVSSLLVTQAGLLIPRYILAEVTLSFLGLGVSEPTPSWGNMFTPLLRHHLLTTHWWMVLPGFLLTPTTLAYFALVESTEPGSSNTQMGPSEVTRAIR
jgi:peptide/nickel transport system permease protein